MAQISLLFALCLVCYCLLTAEGRIMPAAARGESVNDVASTNTTRLLSSSSNPRLCSSSFSCPPPSYTGNSSPSISATDLITEVPAKKMKKQLLKVLLRFVLPPALGGTAVVWATICICFRWKKKRAAAQIAADASGDAKVAEV